MFRHYIELSVSSHLLQISSIRIITLSSSYECIYEYTRSSSFKVMALFEKCVHDGSNIIGIPIHDLMCPVDTS